MHLASPKQMQMEVVHRLAPLGPGADDDPIAFSEPLLMGDCGGCVQQPAQQSFVSWLSMGQGGQMLLGNDEDVNRGARIDVVEGEDLIVFPDLFRGYGPGDDLAEDAFHSFPPEIRNGCKCRP